MRLAIIRQQYTPQGGAERFLEGALEALLERNVAITVYAREWPQTKLALIEPHIIDPPYLGSLWRDWGFAREVGRAIGRSRANLVQAHERVLTCDIYRPPDGVHATWLDEHLRDASPFARMRIALSPWHRYTLAMERKLFASPWLRAVLCNSKMVRDDIMTRFGLPAERLPVIYSAVDANVYSPQLREHRAAVRARYQVPDDAVLFLLVGSGYRRKGLPTALAALARLPSHAHLMVVGEDHHLDTFKRQARDLGVRERVVFAGWQADAAPFYGASDAFVLPTLYDSFPDAAMEALASGLPVVTSTMSGAAELVREHDCGFVCASRDSDALAAHMTALLDAGTRARFAVSARDAVLPLSPAAMTLKLVLLYKELLEASVAHRMAARPTSAPATTPPVAAGEAPPLHGEDGLQSETLPSGHASPPELPQR